VAATKRQKRQFSAALNHNSPLNNPDLWKNIIKGFQIRLSSKKHKKSIKSGGSEQEIFNHFPKLDSPYNQPHQMNHYQ
jgi:hypothetical protein